MLRRAARVGADGAAGRPGQAVGEPKPCREDGAEAEPEPKPIRAEPSRSRAGALPFRGEGPWRWYFCSPRGVVTTIVGGRGGAPHQPQLKLGK